MNELHRKQLKALVNEIIREETRVIISETESVIDELLSEEIFPEIETTLSDMIESRIQKKACVGDPLPGTEPTLYPGTGPRTLEKAGHEPGGPVADPSPPDADRRSLLGKIPALHEGDPDTEVTGSEGLYLYGIVENTAAITSLRAVGIDDQVVSAIPCRDLAAIVHTCPLVPYRSDDESLMKEWILAHQKVLEIVAERCGTVIPFGFDTIIMPDGDRDAGSVLLDWLSGEYDLLQTKMARFRNKKEYGVQVFCSLPTIADGLARADDAIKAMVEELEHSSPGKAYMIRQKIEREEKKGIESELQAIAQKCHETISAVCDEIKVEKPRKTGEADQRMLLNYSCLVSDNKYSRLGDVLESLEKEEGLIVRFTGPWPVYSFV